MLFSFITCSHRAPQSWSATFDSLAAQEAPGVDFEVLVVNNGFSTERERALLASAPVRQLGSRLKLIQEPTPGVGFARAAAFRQAQGKWFITLDDDNTIAPDLTRRLAEVVAENSEIGGIVAMIMPEWESRPPDWLESFGKYCLSYNCPANERAEFHARTVEATEVSDLASPPGGGMIIRSDVVGHYLRSPSILHRLAKGRTGNSFFACEDYDLWSEIISLGLKVAIADEIQIKHHIPASRTRLRYLIRLNYQMSKSFGLLDGERRKQVKLQSWPELLVEAKRHAGKARKTGEVKLELLWWVKTLAYQRGLRRGLSKPIPVS